MTAEVVPDKPRPRPVALQDLWMTVRNDERRSESGGRIRQQRSEVIGK